MVAQRFVSPKCLCLRWLTRTLVSHQWQYTVQFVDANSWQCRGTRLPCHVSALDTAWWRREFVGWGGGEAQGTIIPDKIFNFHTRSPFLFSFVWISISFRYYLLSSLRSSFHSFVRFAMLISRYFAHKDFKDLPNPIPFLINELLFVVHSSCAKKLSPFSQQTRGR